MTNKLKYGIEFSNYNNYFVYKGAGRFDNGTVLYSIFGAQDVCDKFTVLTLNGNKFNIHISNENFDPFAGFQTLYYVIRTKNV